MAHEQYHTSTCLISVPMYDKAQNIHYIDVLLGLEATIDFDLEEETVTGIEVLDVRNPKGIVFDSVETDIKVAIENDQEFSGVTEINF